MANGRPGAPKGTINNPKGTNQFASGKGQGEKNTCLIVRLSDKDKQRLKLAAKKKGKTLSGWLLELAFDAASA